MLNKLSNTDYLNALKHYSLNQLRERCPNYYEKWYAWVVTSLREIGIVEEKGHGSNIEISLASPINKFIEEIIVGMEYEKMFFNNINQFEDIKDTIRYNPRNQKIIQEVIKENDFKCFFDKNHITFPSNTKPNYVEGHHIIPISRQDSFEEELDCKENIIALCPNCHKAIHYAINDYKKDLLEYIIDNNEKINKFNISLEDMKENYFNKKIPAE